MNLSTSPIANKHPSKRLKTSASTSQLQHLQQQSPLLQQTLFHQFHKPTNKIDFSHKISFANKIFHQMNNNNSADTPPLPHNNKLVLTSMQLINFIDFYFNDLSDNIENHDQNTHDSHRETTTTTTTTSTQSDSNLITVCFPCSACLTKFTFEQTFQLHLNRRSVLIRVYCLKCGTFKTFYNKCKLFYHIYSHKLNLFEPLYKCLQIELISNEKLSSNKEKSFVDLNNLFSNLDRLLFDTENATTTTTTDY